MYINVGNADGFVKVYSGPYRVSGVETLTEIPITLSSLVAIVYFPEGFSPWMIGGVSSMTLWLLMSLVASNMHIPQIMKLILIF